MRLAASMQFRRIRRFWAVRPRSRAAFSRADLCVVCLDPVWGVRAGTIEERETPAMALGQCDTGSSLYYLSPSGRRRNCPSPAGTGAPIVLRVDAKKVYAKKPVPMWVRLLKQWREERGLRTSDVISAAKDCLCCAPSAPDTELVCAHCCKNDERVVGVGSPATVKFDVTGTEEYGFRISSLCTSSSYHLQSPDVVLVCVIGGFQVKSNTFSLLSREWKGRKKQATNVDTITNAVPLPRRKRKRKCVVQPFTCSPFPATGYAIMVKMASVSVRISINHAKMLLAAFDNFWGPDEVQRRDKVLVELCSKEALEAAITGVFDPNTELVWFVMLVSLHTSLDSVAQLNKLIHQFATNRGPQNPDNVDLVASGDLKCIASVTNY
eukprot:TRINITY_DN1160_c0_g1_i11.p1 TRINITY_DN1160_c0_g1~~TRINITY_DN1160_c0_g1_i11.p1  ORF type:complete len:380 (+),score=59.21 TRINITY_DN1160_c0_g1_i11:998-2137(+)